MKLYYAGQFFRAEAPQAGRFRQFTQIGAEVLGTDDPAVDAEVIALLADISIASERAACTSPMGPRGLAP